MKKAFTLIELLVVIAIIAILAAILSRSLLSEARGQEATAISAKADRLAFIQYWPQRRLYPRRRGCELNTRSTGAQRRHAPLGLRLVLPHHDRNWQNSSCRCENLDIFLLRSV